MSGLENQETGTPKPDWFILADADRQPSERRRSKSVQLMAITAPLLMLGAGLVFAQTGQPQSALANGITTETAAASTPVAGQPAQTSQSVESVAPSTPAKSEADSSSSPEVTTAANPVNGPVTAPTKSRVTPVKATQSSPSATHSGVFTPPATLPTVASGSDDPTENQSENQGDEGRDGIENSDEQEGDD